MIAALIGIALLGEWCIWRHNRNIYTAPTRDDVAAMAIWAGVENASNVERLSK